jgi:hypothetical protein
MNGTWIARDMEVRLGWRARESAQTDHHDERQGRHFRFQEIISTESDILIRSKANRDTYFFQWKIISIHNDERP